MSKLLEYHEKAAKKAAQLIEMGKDLHEYKNLLKLKNTDPNADRVQFYTINELEKDINDTIDAYNSLKLSYLKLLFKMVNYVI